MRQMLKNSRKKFKELTRGFEPRNIINLDEAAIFIKLLPNRTLCNQAKVNGTKMQKDRTVEVFCAYKVEVNSLVYWKISNTQKFFRNLPP